MNMVQRIRGTLRISVAPHSNPSTIVAVLHVLRCVREIQETVKATVTLHPYLADILHCRTLPTSAEKNKCVEINGNGLSGAVLH
jgi:hypothetical protein